MGSPDRFVAGMWCVAVLERVRCSRLAVTDVETRRGWSPRCYEHRDWLLSVKDPTKPHPAVGQRRDGRGRFVPQSLSSGDSLETTRLLGGQRIVAHNRQVCIPPCPIHTPSDHHMRMWRQLYRGADTPMERMCVHNIGHPDPDDILARTLDGAGIHGCDGCCHSLRDLPPDR